MLFFEERGQHLTNLHLGHASCVVGRYGRSKLHLKRHAVPRKGKEPSERVEQPRLGKSGKRRKNGGICEKVGQKTGLDPSELSIM